MRTTWSEWLRFEGHEVLLVFQRSVKKRPHAWQVVGLVWLLVFGTLCGFMGWWLALFLIGLGPLVAVLHVYCKDDYDWDPVTHRVEHNLDTFFREAPKPHGDPAEVKDDEWTEPWL